MARPRSYFPLFLTSFGTCGRDVLNPNNLAESEFIWKRIVPFLINRIENMNIHIRLLINVTGV